MKYDYLINTLNSFEDFKKFLIKHNRIQHLDNILKEIKTIPYSIIIRCNNVYIGYNNLFKYTLTPYNKTESIIYIKDLIENRKQPLHITNILDEWWKKLIFGDEI